MPLKSEDNHFCCDSSWNCWPKHMNFVQENSTTDKSKETEIVFSENKLSFLDGMVATVAMEEIPPELILNRDQTGIKFVPCSTWRMNLQGAKSRN